MGLATLLIILPFFWQGGAGELSQAGFARPEYPTVADWAIETNHTFYLDLFQAFVPQLGDAFNDPAWAGTVFALSNAVLDIAGQMDGLGDFQGILERGANDSAYADGMRQITLYHVLQDGVLTSADLLALAASGANLTTELPGHNIGLLPSSGPASGVLLIPEDSVLTRMLGNPRVIVPDIQAGAAMVHELSLVLLPLLE